MPVHVYVKVAAVGTIGATAAAEVAAWRPFDMAAVVVLRASPVVHSGT